MNDDRLVDWPLQVPPDVTDCTCDRCGRHVAPGEFIQRTGTRRENRKWNCTDCVGRLATPAPPAADGTSK